MILSELIGQPEGRRLEFKSMLPSHVDLAKTIVAFANDAGGDIFIGVEDTTHQIIGIDANEYPQMEEQVSNLVFDRCTPTILPEVSLVRIENKALLRIKIYRGSQPPYYLKSEGKLTGTYIRVGSNNRQADEEIVMELERKRHHISFDSEPLPQVDLSALKFEKFSNLMKERTGETLTDIVLDKLQLVKEEQGRRLATRALVLLSDSPQTDGLFSHAKIECARFKGVSSEDFLDQKTIDGSVANQAEEAYKFVLRHINKGAHVKGVYTISHWEYPIDAIREVIRNAVVHRDYSLTGKDIKIAIYDDLIEITSPGLVPPTIDFSDMTSRQSDARNKILAPVFKHLGLIDQWGNGLKVIHDQLQNYPEIELRWKEVGMSLQITFKKKHPTYSYEENLGKGTTNTVREAPNQHIKNTQENIENTQENIENTQENIENTQENIENTQEKDNNNIKNSKKEKNTQIILQIITQNPTITRNQIAEKTGISAETVKAHIALLKRLGILQHEGSTKKGRWVVKNQ